MKNAVKTEATLHFIVGADIKIQKIEVQKSAITTFAEIDSMGRKTLMGKVELSQQEAKDLKRLVKKGVAADSTIGDLQRDLKSARRDAQIWKRRYEELKEQTKDFTAALKRAPKRVKEFISKVLRKMGQEARLLPSSGFPKIRTMPNKVIENFQFNIDKYGHPAYNNG